MNKWQGIGRLTRDPDIRYTTSSESGEQTCIARYTLAIDRRRQNAGADYIPCVAFGKLGEFAEKYLHQGMKIGVSGRIQTGSYTNKEGNKVYTTDVIVEEQEFCEKKSTASDGAAQEPAETTDGGFMNIPEGIENDLPFK